MNFDVQKCLFVYVDLTAVNIFNYNVTLLTNLFFNIEIWTNSMY